jgi:hypothetical protein
LYVYTPILYKGKKRPTAIIYDDNTPADKKKMAKENLTIIEEGIIVYLNKNGEKEAKIVQFIPKDSKGGKNYNKPKDLSKYNGWIHIRDMSGNLIEGVEFDKGIGVRSLKAQDAKRLRTSNCYQVTLTITTWEISECGPHCIDFSTSQSTIELGQYCVNTGYNQDQLPPDFFIEGGGGQIEATNTIQLDYTRLKENPCIEDLIKKALNTSAVNSMNSIQGLIESAYMYSIIDIVFKADNTIPYPAGTIRSNLSSSGKLEIVFKPVEIDAFTKEYAVAVTLHEFQHAIIANHADMNIPTPTLAAEHESMVKNNLSRLAQSLRAVFPDLSEFDAQAITINGFDDVRQNNNTLFVNSIKAAFGNNFDVNAALTRGAKFANYNSYVAEFGNVQGAYQAQRACD